MVLKIDLKIFIFFVLFHLTKQIKLYSTIMILCIIHELGHVLMGLILGMKVEKIEIMPFGLSVSFKIKIEDYNKKIKRSNILELKKIAIAVAGPLTNLLMILIVLFNNIDLKVISNNIFIYSNLLIMLFNLLPIYPLDGGRIAKGFISIWVGNINSKIFMKQISKIVTIFITMIGSVAIIYLQNIAVFFIIIYLWLIVIKENRQKTFMENLCMNVMYNEHNLTKKQT